MQTRSIVQVEFSSSILSARQEILEDFGHPVISLLGADDLRRFDLVSHNVGIVIFCHGESRELRKDLILYMRTLLPGVPVIALLRRSEDQIEGATQNIRADDPISRVKEIAAAIKGIQ